MRTPVFLSLFALVGCSSANFGGDGLSQVEREERTRQFYERLNREQQEAKAQDSKKYAVKAGDPMDRILELWGEPDQREIKRDLTGFWYANGGNPVYFIFDKGKLAEMTFDHESKAAMERNALQARQVAAQEAQAQAAQDAAKAANTANMINGISAGMQYQQNQQSIQLQQQMLNYQRTR